MLTTTASLELTIYKLAQYVICICLHTDIFLFSIFLYFVEQYRYNLVHCQIPLLLLFNNIFLLKYKILLKSILVCFYLYLITKRKYK